MITYDDVHNAYEVMRKDRMPYGSSRKRKNFQAKDAYWLLVNSENFTAKECSAKLGYRIDTIRRKCTNMKVKLKPQRRK